MFTEIQSQTITGPMGIPIDLDYTKVMQYLKDEGLYQLSYRKWVFKQLRKIFLSALDLQMNQMNKK
jgi:hypothetical protein